MSTAPLFEITGVQEVRRDHPEMDVLASTPYHHPLHELQSDRVHVIVDGRIVESGGPELSSRLEAEGYERFGVSE